MDGTLRQRARGANLIRYVPGLLSYASSALRLLPGDVVSTGTLAGAGEVRDGQRIVVDIGPVDRLAEPPRRRGLRRRRSAASRPGDTTARGANAPRQWLSTSESATPPSSSESDQCCALCPAPLDAGHSKSDWTGRRSSCSGDFRLPKHADAPQLSHPGAGSVRSPAPDGRSAVRARSP
ncbi:fumarylacetoacetate hydrolase family protein [Streptomyces sp. NPDC001137]|uniref:fumarylacetoacetate hydrolase family protein n=1 Tax=Streptomyces sp. NPDC001137 TaxID=3154378 RepID=UPI00331F1500